MIILALAKPSNSVGVGNNFLHNAAYFSAIS